MVVPRIHLRNTLPYEAPPIASWVGVGRVGRAAALGIIICLHRDSYVFYQHENQEANPLLPDVSPQCPSVLKV